MTALRATLCTSLALSVAACSGGESEGGSTTTAAAITTTTTSTTAPERPASTTTTAFDPATVEGEVEAAYLASWDVYADAVYDLALDEEALAAVYADELLEVRRAEIVSRVEEGRAAFVIVDHDYEIDVTGENTALIIDTYVNHQVLIDPETKEPIEADPNVEIVDAFSARRSGSDWVLFDLERLA